MPKNPRLSGEELILVLPRTGLNGASAVAEGIRSAIERSRVYNPRTGAEVRRVTLSIGVTEIVHGEAIEQTIMRADDALYRAKEGGRNRVEIARPSAPLAAAG